MNSEVLSLKKKSEDLINSIDYHKEVVSCCESILSQLNPEFAEKKAQQEEMESLRTKVDKMSRDIESLIQALKQN